MGVYVWRIIFVMKHFLFVTKLDFCFVFTFYFVTLLYSDKIE